MSSHRANDTSMDGQAVNEHFAKFFECWLAEQKRDLQSLRAVDARTEAAADDLQLRPLIDRVLGHYEYYYRVKTASAHRDVLPMFSPSWISSTENLFLWIGGWRPTLAIHLLYSKSGIQLESRLAEIITDTPIRDLADLTAYQLERVDRLHRQTVQLEKEISEAHAQAQETVADAEMVELSQMMAADVGGGGEGGDEDMERALEGKKGRIEEMLQRADELRLETLKSVVEILKPAQAVHFLIAAAELHLKVHEFGKRKDNAVANSRVHAG